MGTGADESAPASLAEGGGHPDATAAFHHPGTGAAFRRLDAALTRLEAATVLAAGRTAERQAAVTALQARLDQVIGRLASVLEE